MRNGAPGVADVLTGSFSRYLTVDVLHGTDRVAQDVRPESWSIAWDLDSDAPKASGRLRIVHKSVRGESWVPRGAKGILSPFKATLLLTEVISAGGFESRVQLGFFDVVSIPYAEDAKTTIGYAPKRAEVFAAVVPSDSLAPADELLSGDGGVYLSPGRPGFEVVVSSVVEVEVESLDARVNAASFRSPRAASSSAWGEWQAVGILPVVSTAPDVTVPATTWPAERGSRLAAVQHCARLLGGVPFVDSLGRWALADDNTGTVTLSVGEGGTVIDLASTLTLQGFYNVVVGDYETEDGHPLRAVWVADGALAPDVMGREFVRYHKSDMVRTEASANDAVASVGALSTTREVDVEVDCVYNPLLEIGDHAEVLDGDTVLVSGVAVMVACGDSETMRVVIRERRQL